MALPSPLEPERVCVATADAEPVDPAHSFGIFEKNLAEADIFNESQELNARLKVQDLLQGKRVWQSVPFRLELEFNRLCNVKCIHCDIKRGGTGDLGLATVERLLDEIGWGVQEVMPLVGGEPTLAPIQEVAPLLRRHNIYLNFITNGWRFTRAFYEPIADITGRIQFSFHSHVPAYFERIMPGVPFAEVVQNIRDTVAIAAQTQAHVVPCVVVMDEILDSLPDYVDFVADLGIERMIVQKLYPQTKSLDELDPYRRRGPQELEDRFGQIMTRAKERGVFIETNVAELFADPDNIPRSRSRFDILQQNVDLVYLFRPGFCMSTATVALVEWDGTVLPCCEDRIVLGNVHQGTFEESWNGEAMQRLRQSFFDQDLRPYCALCKQFYLGHP